MFRGTHGNITSGFIQGDDRDEDAKLAYQSLSTFHLYEPTTDEYLNFLKEVERRQTEELNWTRREGDDVSLNLFMESNLIVLINCTI